MPQMFLVELGGIERIACLPDEFLVIRYLRAEGGKEVSYDGRIDADIETAKLINQGVKVILRAATDQEANHFRADNLGTVVQASVILSQEMDKLVRLTILKGDSPVDNSGFFKSSGTSPSS